MLGRFRRFGRTLPIGRPVGIILDAAASQGSKKRFLLGQLGDFCCRLLLSAVCVSLGAFACRLPPPLSVSSGSFSQLGNVPSCHKLLSSRGNRLVIGVGI